MHTFVSVRAAHLVELPLSAAVQKKHVLLRAKPNEERVSGEGDVTARATDNERLDFRWVGIFGVLIDNAVDFIVHKLLEQ